MYCATCGSPVSAGLSFCNRCGTSLAKERTIEKENTPTGLLISAVVMVAIFGLAITFAGAIALKKGAELGEPVVVFFMLMCFVTIALVELFLMRQVSRVTDAGRNRKQAGQLPQIQEPLFQPAMIPANEIRRSQLRTAPEGVSSVTENTTRTLAHAFREDPE